MKYTVKRINSVGMVTFNQSYPTYRKAFNAACRIQEKSSKSSKIELIEDDRLMDTFTGLI